MNSETTTPNPVRRSSAPLTKEERLARLAARRSAFAPATDAAPRSKAAVGGGPPATQRRRTKRRHPAKGSRIAALGMSVTATTAMSFAFANADRAHAATVKAVTVSAATQTKVTAKATAKKTVTTTAEKTVTTTAKKATTTATTRSAASASGSGTFDGSVAPNKWGPVQVEITVASGKITQVTLLQTPASKPKSVRINDEATPILTSEALTAQSAQVDTVSGATYTSDSYRVSLQSAIDAARAAGVTVS